MSSGFCRGFSGSKGWGLVSLTEFGCGAPVLSLCHLLCSCVCWRWGRSSGDRNNEFSPYRHIADRDIWAVDMSGPRGDPKAVLPLPALMLLSAMPEAARLRSKGASSPSRSGEAAWVLSCPARSSVLSEGAENPQVAEKVGAGQGLSMGCLISKPAGVPGYQWLCMSKSCLKP